MVQSKVPDGENDPIIAEARPYHFVRQQVSLSDSRGVKIELGDLNKLRCFTLGINLINMAAHETKKKKK